MRKKFFRNTFAKIPYCLTPGKPLHASVKTFSPYLRQIILIRFLITFRCDENAGSCLLANFVIMLTLQAERKQKLLKFDGLVKMFVGTMTVMLNRCNS